MDLKMWLTPVLFIALLGAPPARAEDISEKLDIFFLPTPEPVVDEMLRLAAVGEGDTVYDLGCGDGRIVITAARRYGAPGVGIDLDPQRIAESVANAKAEGVEDKVRFIEGDLFDANLSEASVVTLYLLGSVNERLRPKLLRELRPGARVVSHDFGMGVWRPDKQSHANGAKVFLWVVPAVVEGRWQGAMHRPNGDAPFSLLLEQSYQDVTGIAVIGGGHMAIDEARLEGDRLGFAIRYEGGEALTLTGRIAGDAIEGWVYAGDGDEPISRWSAARIPSALGEMLTTGAH